MYVYSTSIKLYVGTHDNELNAEWDNDRVRAARGMQQRQYRGRGQAEEERIDQGSPYANKRNHLHCIVYAIKCLDKKEIETAALTC